MSTNLAPRFGVGRSNIARATLGVRPAAGILFRTTDADGAWWLLAKRTSILGGTWSTFGGSLEPNEEPLAGAVREVTEEAGLDLTVLAGGLVVAEIQTGTPRIPYHLYVIDVPADFDVCLNWENDDAGWWHGDDVAGLNLHSGLAAAWPTLAALAPVSA